MFFDLPDQEADRASLARTVAATILESLALAVFLVGLALVCLAGQPS
jgi:hypothetical protein